MSRRLAIWFSLPLLLVLVAGCSPGKAERLKIGDPAPDFTVEDLEGRRFRLSDFAGKAAIIRFFVTDCPFCKADTPVFNDYYEKHREDGLVMLYLTTTVNRQQVDKFVRDLAIPFPVAIDYGKKVSSLYNIKVEPQTVVLDRGHIIRGAILGGVTAEELDEILGGA